jgi:hypothetical protein
MMIGALVDAIRRNLGAAPDAERIVRAASFALARTASAAIPRAG